MRRAAALTFVIALMAPSLTRAQSIEVTPVDSRPALVGPEHLFTGTAIISPLFSPHGDNTAGGAEVTFAPGARTAWHSHPAGQVLLITAGVGWVQERGGERREVRPGDVVWTPPNVEHWHGATADDAMTHTAIHEAVDGSVVEWLEHVSDEEYQGG
jgi:quercetin dioxygenase-like cupin family protein